MEAFPHHYQASASGGTAGTVTLSGEGLPEVSSAPPSEFGGPGDRWSPETLLVAAVADCFVLSFRAVAAASKFEWSAIECHSQGTLDRIDRVTRFTEMTNTVKLSVPAGTSRDTAMRLLQKAEQVCLISNSLSADVHLQAEIVESG